MPFTNRDIRTLSRISDKPGTVLGAREYLDDFWVHYREASGDFWKLERRQHFVEPGVPSWDAFVAGDWERALELAEETRVELRRYLTESHHLHRRRIRVVEEPVTSYLQWEMQMLRIRVEEGDNIRVLPAAGLCDVEWNPVERQHRPLPELILLGTSALYEVHYDDSGTHIGARRIDDTAAVAACQAECGQLYERGEDLITYFHRVIAPLPPPVALA